MKLWIKSGRRKTPKEIGEELGVSSGLIRKWKHLDDWDNIPTKRPRGAPKGNKNAAGNTGGPGGPFGNEYAVKHGLFKKYEPQDPEYLALMEAASEIDPLDMIWSNITRLFGKILWSQRIMHVQDKDDLTKEIKKKKNFKSNKINSSEVEYELQFAHDKMAAAMKAEAVVMREMRSAIKQFLEAAPANDERRMKLDIMQSQVEKMKLENEVIALQREEMKEKKDKTYKIILAPAPGENDADHN